MNLCRQDMKKKNLKMRNMVYLNFAYFLAFHLVSAWGDVCEEAGGLLGHKKPPPLSPSTHPMPLPAAGNGTA